MSKKQIACLMIKGEPGEYISAGQSYHFDLTDSVFTVTVEGGRWLEVEMTTGLSSVSHWTLEFSVPEGVKLRKGTYRNAERCELAPPNKPGLDVKSPGRASNEIFGEFTIEEVRLNRAGDKVVALTVNFTMRHNRPDALPLTGRFTYFEPKNIGKASALLERAA